MAKKVKYELLDSRNKSVLRTYESEEPRLVQIVLEYLTEERQAEAGIRILEIDGLTVEHWKNKTFGPAA